MLPKKWESFKWLQLYIETRQQDSHNEPQNEFAKWVNISQNASVFVRLFESAKHIALLSHLENLLT